VSIATLPRLRDLLLRRRALDEIAAQLERHSGLRLPVYQ
jgi:hypothetical protein